MIASLEFDTHSNYQLDYKGGIKTFSPGRKGIIRDSERRHQQDSESTRHRHIRADQKSPEHIQEDVIHRISRVLNVLRKELDDCQIQALMLPWRLIW